MFCFTKKYLYRYCSIIKLNKKEGEQRQQKLGAFKHEKEKIWSKIVLIVNSGLGLIFSSTNNREFKGTVSRKSW
jgi:hypothetical protein